MTDPNRDPQAMRELHEALRQRDSAHKQLEAAYQQIEAAYRQLEELSREINRIHASRLWRLHDRPTDRDGARTLAATFKQAGSCS